MYRVENFSQFYRITCSYSLFYISVTALCLYAQKVVVISLFCNMMVVRVTSYFFLCLTSLQLDGSATRSADVIHLELYVAIFSIKRYYVFSTKNKKKSFSIA